MSEEAEDINVEVLISLIRDQPAIWDRSREDYKHRDKKKDAWNSVSEQLTSKFQDFDEWEKREFTRLAMKKWNNIRDHWIKWKNRLKMTKKSGVRGTKVRKYLYHEELTFMEKGSWLKPSSLNKNVAIKEIVANQQHTRGDSSLESHLEDISVKTTPLQSIARKRRQRIDNLEQKILKVIEGREQQDRHMQFFKSILPFLKLFSEDQIIDFQMGVLQVVRNIQSTVHQNRQQQMFCPQNDCPYDQPAPSSSSPPDFKSIDSDDIKCIAPEAEDSPSTSYSNNDF